MRRLTFVLFIAVLLVSIHSALAQVGPQYQMTVSCLCDGESCYPTIPGPPNVLGNQNYSNASIANLFVASDTSYITADQQQRWKLDGYSLDNGPVVNASSVSVLMFNSHSLVWLWHKESIVNLVSNFGNPALTGGGWQRSGATITISAPQNFFSGTDQYLFQRWSVMAGDATLLDASQPTTNATLGSSPVTIQSQYIFVSASATITYTTVITVTNGTSVYVTTSTGVFAHDTSTIRLQIKNGVTPLYGANVTVKNDAGETVWKGLTDTQGLTETFSLKNQLIYIIHVQYQSMTYTSNQKFPQSQTYPIDVSQGQPKITLQQIAPYVIPLIGVAIVVVAIVIYLHGRNRQERPKYEWVNR